MIIDCFTFFNELELLEVRLHTLAPYVDAFVLCEANRTFQGAEKPYIFSDTFPLFDAAKKRAGVIPVIHGPTNKTVYIVRDDLGDLDATDDPWQREQGQRRRIFSALRPMHLESDDRIILSDIDEIPKQIPEGPATVAWSQDLYYYWVNMRCWKWTGPVSCTWRTLREQFNCDLQALRDYRHQAPLVIDGGWHFSFLGGAEAIKAKIEAFSHVEYRNCAAAENIRHALTEDWKHNRDIFGRDNLGMKFEVMPDDSHLPVYLRENKDRFKHWWYEADGEKK